MLFKTNRLAIRYLKTSDLDAFYDLLSNPNVMRYVKSTMSYEDSKKELKRFISYYNDNTKFYNIWAVDEIKTNTFIGICGVYQDGSIDYELAYRLREQFWGQGYSKEMAKGLINYCFNSLDIEELTAYVQIENAGSIHILEQELNFVKECYNEERECLERVYKLKKNS